MGEYNVTSIKQFLSFWHKIALLQSIQLHVQVHCYKYAIIITNGMNVDDKAKVDRILAQDDIIIPDSSPKLLGAVGLPQFMLYAQRGACREGSNRRVRSEGDSCQGSPPCLSRGYGCGYKTMLHLMLQY